MQHDHTSAPKQGGPSAQGFADFTEDQAPAVLVQVQGQDRVQRPGHLRRGGEELGIVREIQGSQVRG